MSQALNRLFRMAVVGGVEVAVRLHIGRGDNINARDDAEEFDSTAWEPEEDSAPLPDNPIFDRRPLPAFKE